MTVPMGKWIAVGALAVLLAAGAWLFQSYRKRTVGIPQCDRFLEQLERCENMKSENFRHHVDDLRAMFKDDGSRSGRTSWDEACAKMLDALRDPDDDEYQLCHGHE
jgi:hypothetical protein